jgi:hypothetical protein
MSGWIAADTLDQDAVVEQTLTARRVDEAVKSRFTGAMVAR